MVLGFEGLGRETFGGVGVFALSGVEEFEMFRSGSDGGERHLLTCHPAVCGEQPSGRDRAMTSYSPCHSDRRLVAIRPISLVVFSRPY